MPPSNRKTNPIPVALDDPLLEDLDRVAGNLKQSRSEVIRSAIRVGLPLVQTGGAPDVLDLGRQLVVRKGASADVMQLDSECSSDVEEVAKRHNASRQKVLIESVRAGLTAVRAKWAAEAVATKEPGSDAQAAALSEVARSASDPLIQELTCCRARERALQLLLSEVRQDPDGLKVIERIQKRMPTLGTAAERFIPRDRKSGD